MSGKHAKTEASVLTTSLMFAVLCGLLVFTTLIFGAVDSWALGIVLPVLSIVFILWSFGAFRSGNFEFSTNLLQLPIAALIIIGLIQLLPLGNSGAEAFADASSSLSLAPYSTRLAVLQLAAYLMFFAAALFILNNEARVRKIVYLIVIFGTLMAFFGILQRLASADDMIYGLRNSFQANPFGPFVNSHHFAAFMELTVAIPLALLFGKAIKKNRRALAAIAVVVMGMAIIFTTSRGGFLSLLAIIGFIIVANILDRKRSEAHSDEGNQAFRRNSALVGSGLALILIILGIVLYLTNDSTVDRVVTMDKGGADISNGRTHFWSIALQIFADNPVIGTGLDSYGMAFPLYDTWNGGFRLERAHNDYLQILSDAGILGFLCVAGFIFLLFRKGLETISRAEDRFLRHTAIGALAGCLGVLIHSFFDFPLRTPSNMYFFLTLAVIATTSFAAGDRKRLKIRKKIHVSS